MALTPSESFAEKNVLDYKIPIYAAHFPELDPPADETYFSTSPLPFVADCHVILRVPTGISQQIIPEEGKASISALSVPFVDLDGFFTSFIAADTKANLQSRKMVILAGYAGMTSLSDFLNIYTGRVQDYKESRPGVYDVKILDSQKALQRKLFRNADKERPLLEETVITVHPYPTPILLTGTVIILHQGGGIQVFSSPTMTPDQYIGDLFVPLTGTAAGQPFYIKDNDTVSFLLAKGVYDGPTVTDPAAEGIVVGTQIKVTPNFVGGSVKVYDSPTMGANQYIGDLFVPLTGNAAGKLFYVKGNDATAFLLARGVTDGPLITNPSIVGISAGDVVKVVPNYLSSTSQPQIFFGNPISLLLMWLTSTGTHYANGPYDVLSSYNGLGISYEDVDIARFEDIRDTYFPGDSHNMQFTITKRETAKKFIETEIFKVLGMYPVLRGDGKISAAVLKPPLPLDEAPPQFTEKETVGIPKWQGNLAGLINEIGFFIDWDGKEFLTNKYYISGDSFIDRGPGRKELSIPSKGLKDTSLGGNRLYGAIIPRRVNAVFSRFALPPVQVSIETRFEKLLVEAGDMVEFSHPLTPDIQNGVRGQEPILVEVLQRRIDWRGGKVSLQLLDTGFQRGTYEIVSPAMKVTEILSDTEFLVSDADGLKYRQFISPVVKIISDFGVDKFENITIISIEVSPVFPDELLVTVSPAVPGLEAGWHVIFDKYDSVTEQQKVWGYIADADGHLGTADDPAHLVVP